MVGTTENTEKENPGRWGTWEELLLACAVKRHGFNNWDSVSTELQTKTSLPHPLTTPTHCKQKYQDLNLRFKNLHINNKQPLQQNDDVPHIHIPWLEDLRQSRLAELRRDLQRFDLSILSLESKVKKLEEEREREKENCLDKADLEIERSETTDKKQSLLDGEHSVTQLSGGGGVSGGGGGDGDLQSSASLGRKEADQDYDDDDDVMMKSEPLVGLLKMIGAHQHASLFQHRLQTQESNGYNNIVRQHMDLQTIQSRLHQGFYSFTSLAFYRDLLLLINNALVFFPKHSFESLTARELWNLVSDAMKRERDTQKSDSSQELNQTKAQSQLERSLSLLEKASAPIIFSRKRSSVSAKPSSKFEQQMENDKDLVVDIKASAEENLLKTQAKEKPVTGTRSSRRSSNNSNNVSSSSNKKQNASLGSKSSSGDKPDVLKPDKEGTEATSASKKKRSMVDFLKRIKKNSPAQMSKKVTRGRGGEEKKIASSSKKGGKEKESVLRKSSDKKKAKEDGSPSKRGVGRPVKKAVEVKRRREKGDGKEAKQQRKRARR